MPRIRKTQARVTRKPSFWKIGLYIRLSREDANDGESESVVNQEKILLDYVEKHFSPGSFEVVCVHVDDGLSGTDMFRPALQRLITSMVHGEVNCMMVKTLSRAFRNLGDQEKFLKEFIPSHNLRIVSLSQPYIDNFLDPKSINNLEVPIHGLFNDRFAEATSEQVRKVFEMKRERGEFIGAFAPYGYKKDPANKNHLLPDEDAAAVVRCIYNWFVYEGCSKKGIAQRLNKMGEPNPSAYKRRKGLQYANPNASINDGLWSSSTIADILQNEVYTGTMVQGRYRIINYKVHDQIRVPEDEWFVVPEMHDAVIDVETFEKAQMLHSRDTRSAPGKGHLHLFAGLLRCPDCKKAMHRKVSRGIVYYFCRSYQEKKVCTRHSIREDKLARIVLTVLQTQIALADTLTEEIEQIRRAPYEHSESARLHKSLEKKKLTLSAKQKAFDSLYFDWKNGDISRTEYLRLKEYTAGEIQRIEANIASIQAEIAVIRDVDFEPPCLAAFLTNENITCLNRGLLIELIDTIWVYEGGAIMIDLNFLDQHQRTLGDIAQDCNDNALPEQTAVIRDI